MAAPTHFTDWSSTPGREVMPGDLIWSVTGADLQVIRAEMAPGSDFPIHTHPHEQIIVVLEGALEFEVGGERQVVRTGGVIHAPPGIPHGGRVHGDVPAVTLEAFHPPRQNFVHSSAGMSLQDPR